MLFNDSDELLIGVDWCSSLQQLKQILLIEQYSIWWWLRGKIRMENSIREWEKENAPSFPKAESY